MRGCINVAPAIYYLKHNNIMRNRNFRLFVFLLAVGAGMLALSYAFVPLYSMFCQLLGIPQARIVVGEEGLVPLKPENDALPAREITVRFMGNSANHTPVTLTPVHKKIDGITGESFLTAYQAVNNSNKSIKGVAVHTIVAQTSSGGSPDVSGYVDLQQCFCFEEQVYPPHQTINLPLSFKITKDVPAEVHTITFGYTLYEAPPD